MTMTGRWPRDSGGQASAHEDERARSDLHDAPRRRQVRRAELQDRRRSARRRRQSVVNALSRELVATVRRDGATWEQRYKQGAPVGGVKKLGPARGTGTTVFFRPDPTIFPKTEFDAAVIRERLEIASYLHKGLKITFENEAAEGDAAEARGRSSTTKASRDYLKKILAERKAQARARGAVRAHARARRNRPAARPRAALDRVDRRAPPQLRQRHSDRDRAARTRTACARASARRSATSSTRTASRRRA